MSRESRIADAIQSVPDHESLKPAELQATITAQTETPNRKIWKRADLENLFGREQLELVVSSAPVLVIYVAEGIDFGHDVVRQRLSKGGDFRDVLGDTADALLELGVSRSSIWSSVGDGEEPTEKEIDDVLATIINQRLNRQRLADAYNAAAALVESDPAATWDSIAELLGV